METLKKQLQESLHLLQAGEYARAELSLRHLLSLDIPDKAVLTAVQKGLGMALWRGGKPEEASKIFSDLVRAHPGDLSLALLHGNALASAGKYDQGVQEFTRILQAETDYLPALKGLARCLARMGKEQESLDIHARIVALDAETPRSWFEYGIVCLKAKESGRAREAFEKYLERDPKDPLGAKVYLARLAGEDNPKILPEDFVRTHFDDFAEGFENQLVGTLKYRGHELIAEAVNQLGPDSAFQAILDLGCGTGLCADLFKDRAQAIDGIDLAPRMIEIARKRAIYRELYQGDLIEVMHKLQGSYDLALGGDLFIYIGDPGDTLRALHPLLKDGGLFSFTIETLEKGSRYQLCDTLRYKQAPEYIQEEANKAGFTVKIESDCTLRTEESIPVPGKVYVLTKNS